MCFVKFSKDKNLHLEKENPGVQHSEDVTGLGQGTCGKGPASPV